MDDANNPITAAALSSVVTAILIWISGKGWPVIKESLGWMSDREKMVREQAKEGPIMVLEEVKRQLAETKESALKDRADYASKLAEVLIELKDIRKQHHDCEMKHAELQTELKYLRQQVSELKGEFE